MIFVCLPASRSAWTMERRKLAAATVSGLLMGSLASAGRNSKPAYNLAIEGQNGHENSHGNWIYSGK
jgi:hypothetical protein